MTVSPKKTRAASKYRVVGTSPVKVDGPALVTGRAVFVDDVEPDGLLHAAVLRSPHAHARIKKIDASAAEALPGVKAVLTHKDVPRNIFTTAGQNYPEPSPYDSFVIDRKARFVGDVVAAVAAETEKIARQAVGLIKVEYEVLPPVLDPRLAQKKGAPVIHDEKEARVVLPIDYRPKQNLAGHVDVVIGDLNKAWRTADSVIEGEYSTPYASHCAIEPHITLSLLDPAGRLVIYASTQVPFHARRIVANALNLPVSRVRVIKLRTGGGFGGKQEVLIEQLCAALTLKTGRPVQLFFTREEVFTSSRTRHPQIINLKTGVKKNGNVTGIDLRILMNTGAYGAHALTVVSNSGSKILPLYRCDNIKFWADSVYTNLPVGGAYRGYGATQSSFAVGVQMDEQAHAIGMDPLKFHQRNHIREGETSPIFAALGEGTEGVEQSIGSSGLAECIKRGAKEIGWKSKRGRRGSGPVKRGVGMVILMQGSSIPYIDMAGATIKLNEDGSFNLMVGATDIGTGSDTILAQIAAEVLGVKTGDFIVYSSDTDLTPFDVGAYASSTTYLTGMAVLTAAEKVKGQILEVASEMLNKPVSSLELAGKKVSPRGKGAGKSVTLAEIANYSLYVKNQKQIIASASRTSEKSPPPFAAHFAEVEVDTRTGRIKVVKYVAAVDCGQPINTQQAEGQTEGAVVNGIGMSLFEEFRFSSTGKLLNSNFGFYKIPSARDLPELKTILVVTDEPTGPFGAKSVSEISINGPMPAISNAVFDAVGIRLRHAPFTPEKVLRALREKRG